MHLKAVLWEGVDRLHQTAKGIQEKKKKTKSLCLEESLAPLEENCFRESEEHGDPSRKPDLEKQVLRRWGTTHEKKELSGKHSSENKENIK